MRGRGSFRWSKTGANSCSCSGKKPPIFILDEPTSSMDAKTEKKFIKNFKEYNPDATLLLITHRTSLLTLVDKVIVIDQGKLLAVAR